MDEPFLNEHAQAALRLLRFLAAHEGRLEFRTESAIKAPLLRVKYIRGAEIHGTTAPLPPEECLGEAFGLTVAKLASEIFDCERKAADGRDPGA